MKALLLIALVPILILAALRAGLTPWHLLSPTEYAAMQARVQTLEQQVQQAVQAQQAMQAQRPKISDGTWMREEKNRTSLQRSAPLEAGK